MATELEMLERAKAYMEKLAQLSGLPIWCTTARADVAQALSQTVPNVFPLHLQEKYFDLPDQRI